MSFSAVSEGEHAATWHHPDYPQFSVTGRYIVNADGTSVIEFFEDLQEKIALAKESNGATTWSLIGPDEYPVLNGEANGKMITAYSARLIGMSKLSGSIRVERRQPRYTVESEFYTFFEPVHMKKVRFRADCLARLASWYQEIHGIREAQSDGSDLYTVTLSTKPPQTADLGDVRITLTQEYRREVAQHDDGVSISKYGMITIDLENELLPSEIARNYIRPIMQMLSLMSAQPEGLSNFEFSHEECPRPNDDLPSGATHQPLWLTVRAPFGRTTKGPSEPRIPLHLLDLTNWQEAIQKWLPWAQAAAAELQLMSLLLDPTYPWLEAKFITCAQMIEGLHRKSFQVSKELIAQNETFVTQVVAALTADDKLNSKKRRQVKSALKYLYEPSLEQRIKALDANSGGIVSSLDGVNITSVAHGCGSLRNAFAHSLDSRPIANLTSVQVAHAALSLIGFSFLLTKLGKTGEEAAAIVKTSTLGEYWARLVTDHWTSLNELS